MESAVTMGLVLGRGGRVGSVGSSGTLNEEAVVALAIVDVVETDLPSCGESSPQLPLIIVLCTSTRLAPPLPDPCSSRSLNSMSSSSREVETGAALAPLGSSLVQTLAPPGRESRLGSVKLSKSESRDG